MISLIEKGCNKIDRYCKENELKTHLMGLGVLFVGGLYLGLKDVKEPIKVKEEPVLEKFKSEEPFTIVDIMPNGDRVISVSIDKSEEYFRMTIPKEEEKIIKDDTVRPLRPAFMKTDSLKGQDVTLLEVLSRKKADSSNFLKKISEKEQNSFIFTRTNLSLVDETGHVYRILKWNDRYFEETTQEYYREFITMNKDVIEFNECYIIKDTENYMKTMGLKLK